MYNDTHGLHTVAGPSDRSVGNPPRSHGTEPDHHNLQIKILRVSFFQND